MKLLKLFFVLLLFTAVTYSQFDKPVLQVGIGLAEPMDQLKGNSYLINSSYNNLSLTLVDSNLYKNHFGAQTGFNVFGSIKINFDKYNIVRGVGYAAFTGFNTFQSKKSGNQ